MTQALNNSQLDWRIGMVTSSYTTTGNTGSGVFRGFTTSVDTFRAWLTTSSTCTGPAGNRKCSLPAGTTVPCTSDDQCWVDTTGASTERILLAAAKAVSDISASNAPAAIKVRPNARVVVVLLGDADDQSSSSATNFTTYFGTTGSTLGGLTNNLTAQNGGGKVVVHGVVCPEGQNCGEDQANPHKNGLVIAATGGVRGDINGSSTSIATTASAIVNAVIAQSGYRLLKPPIGASLKLALSAVSNPSLCNKDDLPRSRVNGFDVDGLARTVALFGACRPAVGAVSAAVSYRYWTDLSSNPNGNPPPCQNDPNFDPNAPDFCKGALVCNRPTNTCDCPMDCGVSPAPPGKICNTNPQVCAFICTADCGGACSAYQQCDQATCTCQCLQSATCAPGFTFVNSGGVCGCQCDTAALNCGPNAAADPNSCACVCKPDCGGNCTNGTVCNPSTCACSGGIG
jgi:hypothetical protein